MNLTGQPVRQREASPERGTAAARRHIARVKELPCVICHRPGPSDAHHCICGRYDQRRASDFRVIPLCKECHQWGPMAIHENKRAWIERNGLDWEYLSVVADMLNGE